MNRGRETLWAERKFSFIRLEKNKDSDPMNQNHVLLVAIASNAHIPFRGEPINRGRSTIDDFLMLLIIKSYSSILNSFLNY